MPTVNLFDLASAQARWLSVRQAAVAGNVANADTIGFKPVDVKPFSAVLDASSRVALAATQPGHVGASSSAAPADRPDTVETGERVVLEDEFVRAGEVRRGMEMNTAVVKAFHRMLLLSVKG